MNNTDNTLVWSKRQLVQSVSQFLLTALLSFASQPASAALRERLLTAVVAGAVAAAGILGLSYVGPHK